MTACLLFALHGGVCPVTRTTSLPYLSLGRRRRWTPWVAGGADDAISSSLEIRSDHDLITS